MAMPKDWSFYLHAESMFDAHQSVKALRSLFTGDGLFSRKESECRPVLASLGLDRMPADSPRPALSWRVRLSHEYWLNFP